MKWSMVKESIKRQAVFFDVDGTLLTKNSGPFYARWLYKQGIIKRRDLLQSAFYMFQYKFDLLDARALYNKIAMRSAGETVELHKDRGLRFFTEILSTIIRQPLVKVLKEHQARGDVVAILTASTAALVQPLAEHLDVEHVLCTHFETDEQNCYTGVITDPPCFGAGKVVKAKEFCRQLELDFASSVAYADSLTDRSLLEAVDHPKVVDPDPLLRRLARKKKWPIWTESVAS
jgi:HAD superfamily hydrolase (TIGR01490 family)